MLYGQLHGEIVSSSHVFGGTGIAGATFLGKPFNAAEPSRISPGFYSVRLGYPPITPLKSAEVAVSDLRGLAAQIVTNGTEVIAGHAAAVIFRDSAGTPVDTNFYLVIVRTSA